MKRSLSALRFRAEDLPCALQSKRSALAHGAAGGGGPVAAAKRDADDVKAEEPDAQARRLVEPFLAPEPGRYRERFASACSACYKAHRPCEHVEERPLKALLIGHNPSDHAWASGLFYSNPTNRMWRLLTGQSLGKDAPAFRGLLPASLPIEAQNRLPADFGVGLTDLGLEPGNNAQTYGKKRMLEWAQGLYKRLDAHQRRAGAPPRLVAFTGKRQFRLIFPGEIGVVQHGEFFGDMPRGWPFPKSTRIWVLPSSSGRAVMTHAERLEPYRSLAAAFHAIDGPGGEAGNGIANDQPEDAPA